MSEFGFNREGRRFRIVNAPLSVFKKCAHHCVNQRKGTPCANCGNMCLTKQ